MSEERKKIDRLLRNAGTYRDPEVPTPGTGWRDAVLMAIPEEADAEASASPVVPTVEAGPLRMRHLIMMSPAGIALFGLGWWVGRGGVSADELAAVPPAVWIVSAAIVAGASLAWYGVPLLRFRRGR